MDVNVNETNLQPEQQPDLQPEQQPKQPLQEPQEIFFQAPQEVKLTDPPFNFPESDVDKNGNLKAVRGRVLKKLLKYEFKALFTGMLVLTISAIAFSILLAIQISLYETQSGATMYESEETPWFLILTACLTFFLNFGTIIASLILPSQRYRKNFFKDEGYLTFSIPASAHEQILAKHISAILCYVAGWLASTISLIIIIIGAGGFEYVFGPSTPSTDPVQAGEVIEGIVIMLELLILSLMFPIFLATIDGAAAWGEQRMPEKNRQVYQMLITIGVISVLEVLFIVLGTSGVIMDFFMLPPTLILFIFIFVGAAIIYGCYCYDIHSFKKNINLK